MSIITVSALAIAICIIILVLKEVKPEFATLCAVAFSAIVLLTLAKPMGDIISALYTVAESSGISSSLLTPVLKVVGVCLVAELAVSICNDAGQTSLATRVESSAKITVLALSIPVITSIFDSLLNFFK